MKTKTSIFFKLLERCQQLFPRFAGQWEQSRAEFGDSWEQEFSTAVRKIVSEKQDESWDEMLHGYAEFCTEAVRAQIYFDKNGKYKADSYTQVNAQCYQNAEFMQRRYLPGLYLSHFIWPHHYRLLRGYIDKLLPVLPKGINTFYEVGVGCGLYSQLTLQALPNATGIGFDISDFALQFTDRMVRANGFGKRYEVRNQNIITTPILEKADFIISQEVLEHLEDPESFIFGLLEGTNSGGWGYISAAINAGHTDHIYLYRSPDDVRIQIENVGWIIKDMQVESNYSWKPIEKRPTVAGFLVYKE